MKRNKPQFAAKKRSYADRVVNAIDLRQRFLIVCEGSKTEPNYFEQFRVPALVIRVKGTGMNTLSLVRKALELREQDDYDQVWCVFDKDDFLTDQFENAINLAHQKGMHAAYSNQAFELWYVLHFEYINTAISRAAYIQKLNGYLAAEYKKNDRGMYHNLRCKMDVAIKNAERLLNEYQPSHPGYDDPSTTVHQLVIALQEQAKPRSR
jgi:hypothetical protein